MELVLNPGHNDSQTCIDITLCNKKTSHLIKNWKVNSNDSKFDHTALDFELNIYNKSNLPTPNFFKFVLVRIKKFEMAVVSKHNQASCSSN